jgi:hypothetical protein
MSVLHESRAIHMPYCLKRQSDGCYVVLNRNYKPLGFTTDTWVKYEEYPVAVKFKKLTARIAAKLSIDRDDNLDTIYLYGDDSIPTRTAADMRAYLTRLGILMSLKLDCPEG